MLVSTIALGFLLTGVGEGGAGVLGGVLGCGVAV
jgi:hypothetical protein